MYPNQVVHKLINQERRKRGLSYVRWNQEMYLLAKDQASYCAKVGRLVHSNRYALQGGENLCGGRGNLSPKSIVRCWMSSKAGHREWLLDPRVKSAGVGIAKSRHGIYAAWAFSGDTNGMPNVTLPNPIEITSKIGKWLAKHKLPTKHRISNSYKSYERRRGVLRIPVSLFLGFIGLLGIVLGAHGLYVYFSRLELMFGGEASKLFLSLDMPIRLRSMVEWMSVKGLQSWFIPAAILAGGIIVFNYSNILELISKLLEKLKLW